MKSVCMKIAINPRALLIRQIKRARLTELVYTHTNIYTIFVIYIWLPLTDLWIQAALNFSGKI
jgi:hypothetical protein